MSYAKRSAAKRWQSKSKPWLDANSPPKGDGACWLWIDLQLLLSPPWQAAPPEVKLLVVRLIEEHHAHRGYSNGELICTFDQFERYGIARRRIKWAIDCAKRLGFVAVDRGAAYGEFSRASKYRLTFRPAGDDLPTNEWKRFKTIEEAFSVLAPKRSPLCERARKEKSQWQPETGSVTA